MGTGASRHLSPLHCLRPRGGGRGGAADTQPPDDETLGHSFCYSRSSSAVAPAAAAAAEPVSSSSFKSISGAAVSANSSASIPSLDPISGGGAAPSFRSSASFSSLPFHLSAGGGGISLSGPLDRPSATVDSSAFVPFSGPLSKRKPKRRSISESLQLRRSISERKKRPWVVPLRSVSANGHPRPLDGDTSVHWAHGKAGEDRVHVVVSEDHRWLFVGIYDGFNGPDAPEFLVSHLYPSLHSHLRGLFWDDDVEQQLVVEDSIVEVNRVAKRLWEFLEDADEDVGLELSGSGRLSKIKNGFGSWRKDGGRIWFRKWRYDGEEKPNVVRESAGGERSGYIRRKMGPVTDHGLVLQALERALEATEVEFLEMTDRAMESNPELAMMGSCLLVVLMRDEDVYVMNLGDSRAIVAQSRPHAMVSQESRENTEDVQDERLVGEATDLVALQLSTDHSMSIEEEVLRIKEEHPDDDQCIANGRVKGRLKVTRAFGAGFLKQPKWNDQLLEIFRNEYIGTAPYISCLPSLCHHKLGSNDQFLVLSSDGLYQFFSNEEVVLHVEIFMDKFPDGDPAQSLIEELLFRAAKEAGMDFYELLDIPQGDRRKYHDDVTVMVISLEGRIWKSSGKYI